MRLVFALLIIVAIEAKKKRPQKTLTEDDKLRLVHKVDKFPEHFQHPVPFGHIYRDGFGDPMSNLKQPFDLVELGMERPRNAEEAKEIWQKHRNNVQIIPSNIPGKFASPRDQYLYEQQHRNDTGSYQPKAKDGRNVSRTWIDWEEIQQNNIANSKQIKTLPQRSERPKDRTPPYARGPKNQYFSPNSFDLIFNVPQGKRNWTTCEDFGRVPNFHPKDVVNIDWVPFYVWASMGYHAAVVHRFTYPTKKLVRQYKDDYGNHLNKSIDWDQPKLVLNEAVEMLLIAGDRTGMFYGIPRLDIPEALRNKPIEFPSVKIRLKIEDPYLAIMHCESQFATIMAVAGNEPTTDEEKTSEAATLKFRGVGYAVGRNIEAEKMRVQAAKEWEEQRKENAVIRVDEPIIRDHFLGRDFMK